jgi:ribosomal protein L30/L7E
MKVKITQTRSQIGQSGRQLAGMLRKVRHLVKVEDA